MLEPVTNFLYSTLFMLRFKKVRSISDSSNGDDNLSRLNTSVCCCDGLTNNELKWWRKQERARILLPSVVLFSLCRPKHSSTRGCGVS